MTDVDVIAPLQRVRAFDRRHPLWWDLGAALLVAALSVNASGGMSWTGAVLSAIVHGAVALRRRRPFPALLVASGGVVLAAGAAVMLDGGMPWLYLAVWVLLFNVGLRRGERHALLIGVLIALTAAAGLVTQTGEAGFGEQVRASFAVLAMCVASLLAGLQIRTRRLQLAAQRAEAARAAVIAERSRIAQEMHDIIGHNLSVITSLANGGAVAVWTSPQDAARAFEAIGAVSRSSVRDVRRVLTVLRHDLSTDGAQLRPQPGLQDIGDLIAAVRSAGLPVILELKGALDDLSPGRQLAVYRIVQESLTNVLRHAAASSRVTVSVIHDGTDVLVQVEDNGRAGAEPDRSAVTWGTEPVHPPHGVVGMRERAEAYGGTLDAGATPAGWKVRARIRAGTTAEGGRE